MEGSEQDFASEFMGHDFTLGLTRRPRTGGAYIATHNARMLVGDVYNTISVESPADKIQCLRCLYTSDYASYKASIPSPVDGTCTWFIEHDKFCDWLNNGNQLLWVSGEPGCGKTVLSSVLIDKLYTLKSQMKISTEVLYFFCDDKTGTQTTGEMILSGILHQLYSKKEHLIQHALEDFKNKGSSMVAGLQSLWDIFIRSIDDKGAGGIIVVVDAIDECELSTRKKLVELISKYFVKWPPGQSKDSFLKVCLTSRYQELIEVELKKARHIRLNLEDERNKIGNDVSLVLKTRLNRMQSVLGFTEQTKSKLQEQLKKKAEETFLWVSMILDLLEESAEASNNAIGRIVKQLPKRLDGVYEMILRKVPEPQRAKEILKVIVTAFRPLSIEELNCALNLCRTDKSIKDISDRVEPNMERTLKLLCGPLVRIVQSKVYLVHQTAKEFLISSPEATGQIHSSWKHCLDQTDMHLVLSSACIWYLMLDEFEQHPLPPCSDLSCLKRYIEKHAFLEYSARYWAEHFRACERNSEQSLTELALTLSTPSSRRFDTWFQLYLQRNYGHLTQLMVAAHFGFKEMVGHLLQGGLVNIEARDASGRTALHWAVHGGRAVVEALLVKGNAVPDVCDSYRETPLQYAVRSAETQVVEALSCCAGINNQDTEGMTALSLAVIFDFEDIAKILVEKGLANVNLTTEEGQTPLHLAAAGGNAGIARLLLEKGNADVYAKDERGRTPLHRAVRGRHHSVARLLVIQGASNVMAVDNQGLSPLDMAAGGGEPDADLIKLLLAEGQFDVQRRNNRGETILHWAVGCGNSLLVKLLITVANANVHGQDFMGQTPLYKAVRSGQVDIMRLLITLGARVNTWDWQYKSPLHIALEGELILNRTAVVEYLVVDAKATARVHPIMGVPPPLHIATAKGYKRLMSLLLNEGDADLWAKDPSNKTAFDIAIQRGRPEEIQILLRKANTFRPLTRDQDICCRKATIALASSETNHSNVR